MVSGLASRAAWKVSIMTLASIGIPVSSVIGLHTKPLGQAGKMWSDDPWDWSYLIRATPFMPDD